MSVAEYVASFISIMIGLSLADLATSLQRLLRGGKRVRWDALTPAAAILVTAFIINVWWTMFGPLNAMRTMSVGAFVPDLIALVILFCLASSALPDKVEAALDLRAYYMDNRKRLWGLFAVYTIWVTVVAAIKATQAGASGSAFAGTVLPNLLMVSLMIVLIVTTRRWAHTVIIGLLLVTAGFAWLPQELGSKSQERFMNRSAR